jgi:uncharacterized protein
MERVIENTRRFVAEILDTEPSSHDMSHVERVGALCLKIRQTEGGDPLVLRLAALLHDAGVVREHREGGDHAVYSAEIAGDFLAGEGVDREKPSTMLSPASAPTGSAGIWSPDPSKPVFSRTPTGWTPWVRWGSSAPLFR